MGDTTVEVTPPAAVPPPKAGYKTSEFWLSAAATFVGLVVASGIIPEQGPYERVVGLVVGLLGALGYSIPRTALKSTQAAGK